MSDEERLDLLDHDRRCSELAEDNARLRKRIEELSAAFEATVAAFRDLARGLGADCCGERPICRRDDSRR